MTSIFWIYMVLNSGTLFFGVLYLLRLRLMPYHEEVIHTKWDELQPETQFLFKAFLAGIGVPFIIIALLNYAILLIPFRHGELWAVFIVPVVGIFFTISGFIVPHYLHIKTGAKTPRLAPGLATIFYLFGFAFSLIHYCC